MLNRKGTQELETDRLILRQFQMEDASDMFNNWASDSEVTKYLSWSPHSSIEVSTQLIDIWMGDYKNPEQYQWAIELKENNKVIGSIGLVAIDNKNENCEIGYCIGKAFWNKGFVTEAFSRILEFVFNEIGFQRVAARHDINNPSSGRVMEKCNLKYEGTLRKIAKNNSGRLVDCKLYSILKDEYL